MHGGSTSLGYAVEEGHCGDFTSEQQSDRGELYKSPDEGSGISEQESASDELYETASEGTESSGSEQASDEGSESESEATEEEHVPLSYQIPTEDLRKAMQASRSSGAAFWHYRLYRDPAGQAVRVHYCKNKEQTERVAALFADKSILGFDLEWKPNCFPRDGIKNSVSLIQIASEDRIALFHIAVHRGDTADELLAPALKQILESRAITKVGVNVRGDYARLRDVFGIDPQGYLELSHLYRVVKFSESQPEKVNKVLVALATQVEDHLQLPLSKGPVRASDWSKDLTMEQQQYAASDAYAGFRLFDVLEAKRKQLKPTPPRPAFHELNLPIRVPVRSVRVIPTRTAAQAQAQPPAAEDDSSDADSEDSDVAAVPSQVLTAETQNACFVPSEISLSPVTVESSENPHGPTQSSAVANASLTNRASRSEEKSPQQIPERPLEVKTAETWVQTWRASLPANYQPKASLTNLRAYSLWHCQALDVEIVAAKLRDPPLAMTTVSLYVLESVRMEGLPFDAGRLRSVLDILPQHVAQGRYRALWRKLQ
ncbi:hypothetical protein H2199_003149 [Coniosporium tulheliwenetii]|nr:hypothetical protein H2199_003149 [Cladosporium sp. JES 115]